MPTSALKARLAYSYFESPLGPLVVAGSEDRLHYIFFPTEARAQEPPAGWQRDDAHFTNTFRQLDAYFAGELTRFALPLHFGGTPFQTQVWSALCDIPFGETISYRTLAERIGKPRAYRAVGAANGANPIPIVVPCHRVIGSDNSLTGFGGGLDAKRFLLGHEQRCSGR